MMYDVMFKFEQKGLETITIKNVESDQSILEVALKINIKNYFNIIK